MIEIKDIIEGAKFKTASGIVWIIDVVEDHKNFGTLVTTSMEHGAKGNYRDKINDVVIFLNEEKAEKI